MNYTAFYSLFLFVAVAFLATYLLPKRHAWVALLGTSMAIFFLANKGATIWLIVSILLIYSFAMGIFQIGVRTKATAKTLPKDQSKKLKAKAKRYKKLLMTLCVLLNVSMLITFKYYGFFSQIINETLGKLSFFTPLPALKFLLPLGISYYTLQGIGYLADVYWGKYPPEKNPLKLALFLSFFPQMVQGPIGRYDKMAPTLFAPRQFHYQNVTFGLQLMLWGLFKKIVIADRIDLFVKNAFDTANADGGLVIVAGIFLYTLQLYADFSGCIDMVIGGSQVLGVKLESNFARPFFSLSIAEFWRRWHITLGAWFKDYIFYPISLSKPCAAVSKYSKKLLPPALAAIAPSVFSLFFVWFCNGLWHGAGYKYLAYGMYYYVLMVLGMLFAPLFAKTHKTLGINSQSTAYKGFAMVRTFLLVNFGMFIFRVNALGDVGILLRRAVTTFSMKPVFHGAFFSLGLDRHDFLLLFFCVLLLIFVEVLQEKGICIRARVAAMSLPMRWCIYLGLMFAIVIFGAYGDGYAPADPIYGNF